MAGIKPAKFLINLFFFCIVAAQFFCATIEQRQRLRNDSRFFPFLEFAAFDFFGELITAKSLSEVIELSSAHSRKQFEALTAQGKELGALAQKVATETAEPIKSGMNKAFAKVA